MASFKFNLNPELWPVTAYKQNQPNHFKLSISLLYRFKTHANTNSSFIQYIQPSKHPSPGERDFAMLLHDVMVIVLRQCPHQSKVSDFDLLTGSQQDVSGSQVSVDEAFGL